MDYEQNETQQCKKKSIIKVLNFEILSEYTLQIIKKYFYIQQKVEK